jgi:DNA polymerase-1
VPADVLKDWPRTEKTNQLSISEDDLKRVSAEIPEIACVVMIKKYEKLLGTFGDELAKRTGTDGRLRASFNVAGTKTGRMSCSDPNMQQLPKDPRTRDCFVADSGYMLIVADYRMMELRAFAEETNDQLLRHDLAQGLDLHQQTASLMNGLPYGQATPEQRSAAKPINFGVIYGAGGRGLARSAWANYGVKLTPEEATAARGRFLSRYSVGARWMPAHADACNRRGYIEIGTSGRVIMAEWEPAPDPENHRIGNRGRGVGDLDVGVLDTLGSVEDTNDPGLNNGDIDGLSFDPGDEENWPDASGRMGHSSSHLPALTRPPPRLRYTLCCNVPIQGGCADAVMIALALVDLLLRTNNIDGGLVLQLHDELVAEVHADQAEQAATLIEQAMTAAFLKVFPNAPVNGLLKVRIVKKWGEAK